MIGKLQEDMQAEAEFTVSKFSVNQHMVNRDKKKIKDILPLVQMAIAKLLVVTESKVERIFTFF